MTEQLLEDPLLRAVREARPAIDEAVLTPTSADALKVLERVLQGVDRGISAESEATGRRRRIRRGLVPAPRGIWRPRFGAIATAAAAAVAAAVIVLSGVSGGPSLVDRAYAAINAGYVVVHEVDIQTDRGLPGYYDRTEGWLLPADGRARMTDISGYEQHPYRTVIEWIVTASGRVFGRACLANCRAGNVSSFIDGRTGWQYDGRYGALRSLGFGLVGRLPGTFAGSFSAAYKAGAIVPDGTATFAGKRVARFESMESLGQPSVSWRPGTPPPASARKQRLGKDRYTLTEWYVDPSTAQPVGFAVGACTGADVGSCGAPISTTRIATFQRLAPTPQNIALLTGPNAPAGAR